MRFKRGELVVFAVEPGLHFTSEGFVTVCSRNGTLLIPEIIDLDSYPSCSDFKGKLTKVKAGDIGVIIKYVGRPWQMKKDPKWFEYDVYALYINGKFCQSFKHNLRRVNYRIDGLI